MYRDDAVREHGVATSWIRQYDVIIAPVPRAVLCNMTLEAPTVADKDRQLLVADEFREERLDTDQLGHLATVGGLDTDQKCQRPQHVRTYELRATAGPHDERSK